MRQQLEQYQQRLSAFTQITGRLSAWLGLFLVLVMALVVALRYVFDFGNIALQESLTYLHGTLFMLGIAYTLAEDEHVRVDVLYQHFSARRKAWVNILGTLLLLLPVCIAIFWLSLDYVINSWQAREGSPNGGLPFIFVLKSLLLVMPVLLALQGVAEILRHSLSLLNRESTDATHPSEGEQ